jgi:hypothetical protein
MRYVIAALLFSLIASAQQEPPKLVGATLLEGQAFEVYQTQDQTIYKKRTDKTKNPEDPPEFKNLLNRQKMFEIGAGIGGAYSKAGDPPGGAVLFANVHPSLPSLARVTVGVEFRNMGQNSGWIEPLPSGGLFENIKGIAEYDYLIIPQGFGGMAFSAGYAYGRYRMEKYTEQGYEEQDPSYEHFLSLRYRWILEQNFANQVNADGSVSHSVIMGYRVSNKKNQEFFVAYALGFGKKASPKVKIQK